MARNLTAKSQIGILKRKGRSRGTNNRKIFSEDSNLVSFKNLPIKRGAKINNNNKFSFS
jgi:hypothetical protein